MPIQSISAVLTDLGRQMLARSATEGVILGDWSFQVGTDGFNPLDATEAEPVDASLQALGSVAGGSRFLGRTIASGFGASAVVVEPGIIQINGLVGIPNTTARRWLRVYSAASANLNGTWFIREWLSATSVVVNAPLATAADAGPLGWEFREACVLQPNQRATDFQCILQKPDATVDGLELGEIAVFCRVLRSPSDVSILGDTVMFANAHHPAITKAEEMVLAYHVCVQS